MPVPASQPRWKNLALIALLAAAVVLSSLPVLDQRAEDDYESLFQRALVTFALARTLNGVISVIQGTELALQPAGVGVTLTPGEILDPVNDLVERFSWIMLGATVSLGLQNVLLDISHWWGMRLAIALLAVAWLVVRVWRRAPKDVVDQVLLRALIIALFLRFAVPLMLIVNNAVFDVFLEPRYQQSTQVIESAGRDLEQLGEQQQAAAEGEERGLFDTVVGNTRAALDLRGRVARMKERAGEVIEHLIELSVVFILQTGLLPIAFLWVFLQLAKRVFRLAPRADASS